MIESTAETISKGTATVITTAGASTSMVSGLWLAQHKDMIAAMCGIGGLFVATIGMVAGIAIQIYWKKKHYELAKEMHRRIDD